MFRTLCMYKLCYRCSTDYNSPLGRVIGNHGQQQSPTWYHWCALWRTKHLVISSLPLISWSIQRKKNLFNCPALNSQMIIRCDDWRSEISLWKGGRYGWPSRKNRGWLNCYYHVSLRLQVEALDDKIIHCVLFSPYDWTRDDNREKVAKMSKSWLHATTFDSE